jgi:hypothetical protein
LRAIYARKLHYTSDSILVEAMKWAVLKAQEFSVITMRVRSRAGNSQDVMLLYFCFICNQRIGHTKIDQSIADALRHTGHPVLAYLIPYSH